MDEPEIDSFPLGSFYVVVRVRPFSAKELTQADTREVVTVIDNEKLIFDQKPRHSITHSPGAHRYRDTIFSYSQVFGTDSTNRQIYEDTGKRLIRPTLDGYNCSIFAYGATGAGKSHTMTGSDASGSGVIQSTLRELYEEIEVRQAQNWTVQVYLSYFEIYNENVRDLLSPNPTKTLALQDRGNETVIVDLTEHRPATSEQVLHIIHKASHARTQAATAENATSSRSHAILQLRIEQKNMDTQQELISKLSLIDLAGSERVKKTSTTGERLIEGININKSLLVLGNCITALVQASNKRSTGNLPMALQSTPYIPYRNSKLTRILKDSLGGASKTIMIAAVSPAAYHFDDTYSTLMYANRAKSIKINATRNIRTAVYSKTELANRVSTLTTENEQLKKEVATLQVMLQQAATQHAATQQVSPAALDGVKPMETPVDSAEILNSSIIDFVGVYGQIKDFSIAVHKLIQTVNSNKQRMFDIKYQLAVLKAERAQLEKVAPFVQVSSNEMHRRLLAYDTKIAEASTKMHDLRELLVKLDWQSKSKFQDIETLKTKIKDIPNPSFQEMLTDVLRLSSMSLRVENLRTNEHLLTTHIARLNASINECRDTVNIVALRPVEDLYTMATMADEKMAHTAWTTYNKTLSSVLFLVENFFENIKPQPSAPTANVLSATGNIGTTSRLEQSVPPKPPAGNTAASMSAAPSAFVPPARPAAPDANLTSSRAPALEVTRRNLIESQQLGSSTALDVTSTQVAPMTEKEAQSYGEEFASLYREYSRCQTPQLGSSRSYIPGSTRYRRGGARGEHKQVTFRD